MNGAVETRMAISSLLKRLETVSTRFPPDVAPIAMLHMHKVVLAIMERVNPKGGIHGGASGDPGSAAAHKLDDDIGDLLDFLDDQSKQQPTKQTRTSNSKSKKKPSPNTPSKSQPGSNTASSPPKTLHGAQCLSYYQTYQAALKNKNYTEADAALKSYQNCLNGFKKATK